jgi:hypothetical protein
MGQYWQSLLHIFPHGSFGGKRNLPPCLTTVRNQFFTTVRTQPTQRQRFRPGTQLHKSYQALDLRPVLRHAPEKPYF